MVFCNCLVYISKQMVDHSHERKALQMPWVYLEDLLIHLLGIMVPPGISRETNTGCFMKIRHLLQLAITSTEIEICR